MRLSRRRIIAAGIAVSALLALDRGVWLAAGVMSGAIRAARPTPVGTSSTRCAQCGSADHTMLDRRCPLAPRVLA